MLIHRTLRDEEVIGNLLIRQTSTYINQDLNLTIRQTILLGNSIGVGVARDDTLAAGEACGDIYG